MNETEKELAKIREKSIIKSLLTVNFVIFSTLISGVIIYYPLKGYFSMIHDNAILISLAIGGIFSLVLVIVALVLFDKLKKHRLKKIQQ